MVEQEMASSRLRTAGDEGDVGTNSTADGAILVNGSIAINGQAVAGYGAEAPEDVLEVNGGAAVITGTPSVVTAPEPLLIPAIVVPDGLACPDAAHHNTNGQRWTSAAGRTV